MLDCSNFHSASPYWVCQWTTVWPNLDLFAIKALKGHRKHKIFLLCCDHTFITAFILSILMFCKSWKKKSWIKTNTTHSTLMLLGNLFVFALHCFNCDVLSITVHTFHTAFIWNNLHKLFSLQTFHWPSRPSHCPKQTGRVTGGSDWNPFIGYRSSSWTPGSTGDHMILPFIITLLLLGIWTWFW